jgi:tetratricopeptide (TPR) repeat protein
LVLAAAVLFGYGGTLGSDFVHDDRLEILENRFVHDLHHVREIFTTPSWGFRRQQGEDPGMLGYRAESNYYRPAQYLTYAILYSAFGPDARAFHGFKILLHLSAGVLLFSMLKRHCARAALPCALLFAVHPALTEAVAWISAITDVLCAVCFLLCFEAYARWREGRRARWLALLYVAFGTGMFSKETMIVFVPVLAAYQRLCEGGWPRSEDLKRLYAPLAVTASLYMGLRVAALRAFVPGQGRFSSLSLGQIVLSQLVLASDYLRLLFVPYPLRASHLFEPVVSIGDGRVWQAAALLGAAVLAVAAIARRAGAQKPLILFGVLWLLAGLAPVVLFFRQIGGEDAFAERYLYLPTLGLCLSIGGALAVQRLRPKLAAAALAPLLVAGAWSVRQRARVWHDPIVFFEDMLRQAPRAMWWQSLGDAYAAAGRWGEAVGAYRSMLALRPDSYQTYCNLGVAYDQMDRLDDAVAAYEASLALQPNEMAYSNVAIAYHKKGRLNDAIRAYHQALALRPTARAYFNLGTTYYLGLGRLPEAIAAYEAALGLEPGDPEVEHALAVVRAKQQRLER